MYRGTMLSPGELEGVRRIEDVVRLGHVQRIAADRIDLERGEVETGGDVLHVDCTAYGLRAAPPTPIFSEDPSALSANSSPTSRLSVKRARLDSNQ